jgi:hypothetical protein
MTMVPVTVQGQVTEKPRVVFAYNSRMGGLDLSVAYYTSYHSTRNFHQLIDMMFTFISTL